MKTLSLLTLALSLSSSLVMADTSVFANVEQSTGHNSYVGAKSEVPLTGNSEAQKSFFNKDHLNSNKTSVQLYGQIEVGYHSKSVKVSH